MGKTTPSKMPRHTWPALMPHDVSRRTVAGHILHRGDPRERATHSTYTVVLVRRQRVGCCLPQCCLLRSATPTAEGLTGTSGEAHESNDLPQGCREWAPSTACEPWLQRLQHVKARRPQWSNSVSLSSVTWAPQSLPAVWILPFLRLL